LVTEDVVDWFDNATEVVAVTGTQPEPAHGLLGRPCLCITPADVMLISRKHTGHEPLCFCLPWFAPELVSLTVDGMLQTGGMDADSDGDTMLSTDGDDELPVTSVPVVAMLIGATVCAGCSGDIRHNVSGVAESDAVTSTDVG